MDSKNRVALYLRPSSNLRSAMDCLDQEKEIREVLTRIGIDHSNAVVIRETVVRSPNRRQR